MPPRCLEEPEEPAAVVEAAAVAADHQEGAPVDTWAAGLACRPAGGACWGPAQAALKSCSAYCTAGNPCKPCRWRGQPGTWGALSGPE